MGSETPEAFLVHRRTGRTAGAVVALGIGGGILVMGVVSAVAGSLHHGAIWPAVKGYVLALLPLFALGGILAKCRRELWLLPEQNALRMLTFRPWLLRGPRVEQASLDEYRAVKAIRVDADPELADDSVTLCVVALVAKEGGDVPLCEMADEEEARALAERIASSSGLPLERSDKPQTPIEPAPESTPPVPN